VEVLDDGLPDRRGDDHQPGAGWGGKGFGGPTKTTISGTRGCSLSRFGPHRRRPVVAAQKGAAMGRGGIIWTVVGILLIIALLIYIF